jgi:hypothetical protein
MKTIFSTILLLALSFAMKAQMQTSMPATVVDPNAPIFKFNEETHDFGAIKEGPTATFDFEFKNTGKTPLLIQSCSASCGCTTPDWTKEPIKPGQKGKIAVKYASEGHPGGFNKTIFITSNAQRPADKKKYEIYIKGNVIPAAANNGSPMNIVPVKH